MCHFLPVHHLGIAFFGGPGRRSKHNLPVSLSKLYAGVLLAVIPRKVRRGDARMTRVHVKFVGRRHEPENHCACPENYINQGSISTWAQPRGSSFIEEPYRHSWECASSAIFDPFTLYPYIHTYQVIKRKEKKQIISLYFSVVVFLCYTTFYSSKINWMLISLVSEKINFQSLNRKDGCVLI